MSVQTYDLGTVLMVPKGDWNSTTAYERLNLVRHNGTAWLCTVAAGQTSVGEEPSLNATNWEILVQDTSSVTSVNGQRGDVVIDESGLVHKAGTETITGDKTFSGTVTAPTPDEDDESTKVATTEWVKNTTLTNAVGSGANLFDVKWSDHRLNDMSWLRSDTFSWHNGEVYSAAYNELLSEYNNAESENVTLNGITCKRTPKKYLIALPSQMTTIQQLFESNGVAWFYILDSTNKRFKLPRTKFGFMGIRNGVGNFVEAGLPNITGEVPSYGVTTPEWYSGAFTNSTAIARSFNTGSGACKANFDASLSNSIYGNSNTVQPPATEMYLYHYVGDFNRQAVLATIGVTSENIGSTSFLNTPVGTIIWSMANSVPSGYLLCNGQAVGRLAYPELFEAIGTTYGEGDGDSTFNLPNLIGKFVEGSATAGIEHEAGLPNVEGTYRWVYNGDIGSGALYTGYISSSSPAGTTSSAKWGELQLDASRSNPIYGASDTVQPPSLTAMPCIKAFDAVVNDGTVDVGELANNVLRLDGTNIGSIGSNLNEYLAHAAMPSDKYVDLTLPANGGTVIAPADGYIILRMTCSANPGGVSLNIAAIEFMNYIRTYSVNGAIIVWLPVKKNDEVTVAWTNVTFDSSCYFRFIYANGSYSA